MKLKKILLTGFLTAFATFYLSCGTAQEALERLEGEIRGEIEGGESESPLPFPTPEEPPIGPIDCPSGLAEGPPVGLACLHCGAPNSRTQAIILASIMRRACRENIATTILLDGTFGDDLELVLDIIKEATNEGSRLHLYIYLSNGPWQRRQLPGGIFTELSGSEWSWQIQTNPSLRQAYADNIRNLQPVFSALAEARGILYLLPALEDNLSETGARAVESLTVSTMAESYPSLPFAMGRNPSSADQSITPGHFRDSHNIRGMPANGLSTNDGEDFQRGEIPPFIVQAGNLNTTFVYWTRSFQGLDQSNVFLDPAVRDYRIPGEAEQEELRDLIN